MARKQARVAAMQLIYEQMEGGDGGEETLRGLIGFEPATAGEPEEAAELEVTEELETKLSFFVEQAVKDAAKAPIKTSVINFFMVFAPLNNINIIADIVINKSICVFTFIVM